MKLTFAKWSPHRGTDSEIAFPAPHFLVPPPSHMPLRKKDPGFKGTRDPPSISQDHVAAALLLAAVCRGGVLFCVTPQDRLRAQGWKARGPSHCQPLSWEGANSPSLILCRELVPSSIHMTHRLSPSSSLSLTCHCISEAICDRPI